ncbi:sugar ABC transporter [Caballeronia sp. LP006]|uniref:sugar ABC transporter n=1 Tax=Caballeronia sp. LP006 TaxID=3038552 RepID=UPI002860F832|nr:sugar ABC transporter [Caballeronia sp. LP006]MDR5829340.1 sugar ABC transporter [Caballeronia sp. LP006]
MEKWTRARAGMFSCARAERAPERFVMRVLAAVLLSTAGLDPFIAYAQAAALQSNAPRASQSAASQPNIAFYYAANPPVDQLQAFDAVVIDPVAGFDPSMHPLAHTTWIARSQSGNAAEIEALWQRGYRGFFLDTPIALAAALRIHAAHPDARLIAGGENIAQSALPYASALYAVVGDSLIRGIDESGQFTEVPEALRARRMAAAREFTQQSGVPVVSIEYCNRNDRQCARDTASRVVSAGMLPYVTSKARDVVGIGKIEVLPRKILVVQDRDTKDPLDLSAGVRDLATPLNYMGYDVEYADFSSRLPDNITPDRYAGVVAWIQRGAVPDAQVWQRWVAARMADHIPVAFLGQFGFDAAGSAGAALDLQPVGGTFAAPVTVVKSDPMIGFEISPKPEPRDLQGVRVGPRSQALLRVSASGEEVDQVALTPWGGYALSPYTVVSLDSIEQERWAIQPMAFMKAALHLQDMPAPSVTTENGRRLFMSHVDGDGFASRAEFPGPDYSGEALYQQIFTRYQVPMTLSVIEGEVGPAGLHPDISPRLEAIARKMFALPHVEIGTHTYSHPFQWEQVDSKGAQMDRGGGDAAFSLNIPGYRFNIDREITGSIDYINSRLAPAGKKTVLLQWSGDCRPPGFVVRKVAEAGVYNFNGGDTVITKSANSWTNIAPVGVDKGPGAYQVYAPNQDENVYTNDWQGPFYGFTRVLETFAMTERPQRFKPIDIYYHMYSGTKVASLRALDQIFSTTLKQPVMPVYVSEYIRKVLDWHTFAVAKDIDSKSGQWLVRGNGEVRELHWPQATKPSVDDASGVTGFAPGPDGTYIHIDNGSARFAMGGTTTAPYIEEANGFVRNFRRTPQGMQFEFAGHYQPFVKVANAQQCKVRVNGQSVAARRDGDFLRFETSADVGSILNYKPVEVACAR